MIRVGIISSQKNPQDFKTWMRFHTDVGVDSFYISIEDTPALGPAMTAYAEELSAMSGKKVHLYYENAPPVDRSTEDNFTDILDRQQERVNRMLIRARNDGLEWVFHIDDDELAYPGSKKAISTWQKVLETVPQSCSSIHIQNWEGFSPAQPVSSWGTDPGVRYLTRDCAHNFAAYANGKAASRTLESQRAHGVHHFRGGKECELEESKGVVLHHEALSMGEDDKMPPARWVEKNLLRLKDDMSKIPFQATHDAVKAVRSGDEALMEETWKKYRSVEGANFKACSVPVQLNLPSYFYKRD